MANAAEISQFLDELLNTPLFRDDSQNGLQVESKPVKIKRVAVAVDSGLSIINKAIKLKCQLLIVHHGIFWNKPYLLNGILGKKIRLLLESGCSLYASHLPLDSHLKYGNAAQLAKFLEIGELKPFCLYHSNYVGVKGVSKKLTSLRELSERSKKLTGSIEPIVLPFGKKDIKNIGIVTGSGSFALEDCANEGLDVLISGEAKQSVYHTAKELGINAIFAGHYATETFGVIELGKVLEKKFKVKSLLIDEPTQI
jgi:dinuclear metal center YbgI/SA1388 family protein